MNYDQLRILFYVLLGLSILFLLITIILFFRLEIPRVIGQLSGRTQRKEIARLKAENSLSEKLSSGDLRKKAEGQTGFTEQMSSGELRKKAERLDPSMNPLSQELLPPGSAAVQPDHPKSEKIKEQVSKNETQPQSASDLYCELQTDKEREGSSGSSHLARETTMLSPALGQTVFGNVNNNGRETEVLSGPTQAADGPNRGETSRLTDWEAMAERQNIKQAWFTIEEEIRLGSVGEGIH